MDKDRLKGFIDDNKEAFDMVEPSADLWSGIENALPEEKSSSSNDVRKWKIITSVAVAASVLIAGMFFFNQDEQNPPVIAQTETPFEGAFADMGDELQEVEMYYLQEVSQAQKTLFSYGVEEELLEEVDLLKEEFDELKEEMGTSANPMAVVQAMIENYELRLEILQSILQEFENKNLKQPENNQNHV